MYIDFEDDFDYYEILIALFCVTCGACSVKVSQNEQNSWVQRMCVQLYRGDGNFAGIFYSTPFAIKNQLTPAFSM